MFEKVFIIYNPLTDAKDWVLERDIKVGSQKLKNVFGVQYIDDVEIMLRYNIPFQEAVMKKYKIIGEENLSIHLVCRLMKKEELCELLDLESNEDSLAHPTWIELKEGRFFWNNAKGCYEEVIENKIPH